ncbi:MAG: carbohydrate kinase family protein [Spirochaetota bacterium]
MNKDKTITINATGCCLVDYLYTGMDFTSSEFATYASRGGITPGKLVFSEDVAQSSGVDFPTIERELLGSKAPDTVNLGGPAVVALMNSSQLLSGRPEEVATAFWTVAGTDDAGRRLRSFLAASPITQVNIKQGTLPTPNTVVLSDPAYNTYGERAFINTIGAAAQLHSEDLPETFFDADIAFFGGTALVPDIHDHLTTLLQKAKAHGCFTVVGTVYDFRNEKLHPGEPWPLGEGDSYQYIDLLIVDEEEALRLTGTKTLDAAAEDLIRNRTGAFIITKGAKSVWAYAGGKPWRPFTGKLPVCDSITDELIAHPEKKGDTTGCGDNYVGGVMADIACQLRDGDDLDIVRAHMVGSVSGGYACFYAGGAFFERQSGEKLQGMLPYMNIHSRELGIELPECWAKES